MQGLLVSRGAGQVLYSMHTRVQVHLLGSETNQPLFSSTRKTMQFGCTWEKPMGWSLRHNNSPLQHQSLALKEITVSYSLQCRAIPVPQLVFNHAHLKLSVLCL